MIETKVNQNISDCISRKDARRLHCKICRDYCTCYRNPETCEDLKAFDSLSSVTPKERTGEWINITNQDLHDCRTGNRLCFECPKCKSRFTYRSNYCPNCGCYMGVEREEA